MSTSTRLALSCSTNPSFFGTEDISRCHLRVSDPLAHVNLDHTPKLVDVVRRAARFPEALEHKPSRLLGNADFLRQLHRRDSLSRRDQQVHGANPLVKWDVRAAKDRTRTHSEVLGTRIATVKSILAGRQALSAVASWTDRSIRPETSFQVGASAVLRGEHLERGERANSGAAHA